MGFSDETMRFNLEDLAGSEIENSLLAVYTALADKGYEPVNQIVGYLLSGDPAYIPRHNEARAKISRLNRDDIVEELVKDFLKSKGVKA
ncbi:MAG: IreB family regulatory phosphoprotein [Streptococcaceae bacterium]|jgi:uncharacterized protein (UPF0297 family)|nr:IreB family regulatory phosphoprotein [Streptococcaceae bacterium]